MRNIIQNAILIKPHNTILVSRKTHDYQYYNGVSLDGGFDYQKITYTIEYTEDDIESLLLYEDSDENEFKNKLIWGTYGKDGMSELKYVKLIDCDTDHLEKIMEIIIKRNFKEYITAIKSILNDRKNQERIDKINSL